MSDVEARVGRGASARFRSSTWLPSGTHGFIYNALLAIFFPAVVAYIVWRLVVLGKSRQGLAQRLGLFRDTELGGAGHDEHTIWIHAVSVGEVAAAIPIIENLRLLEPLARIVLSTTTPTGREMAEQRGADVDALIYFPLDFPWIVRSALDAVGPSLVVMVDTELWPNFLWAANARGIKALSVNTHISDRSFRRSRFVAPVYRWILRSIDGFCAQSQVDADRLLALGANEDAIAVVGNTKFDEPWPDVSEAQAAHMRQELGLGTTGPVIVAGSTNPGEDLPVLEAFWRVRVKHPDVRLVIAPRHPERADEIERMVTDHGWQAIRRTQRLDGRDSGANAPEDSVVILDTIGELARVYAVADVVFVGGSLVPKGGHNILQPLAQGKPVLFGPYMHNQRDLAAIARREGLAWDVRSDEELARKFTELIESPAERDRIADRGVAVLEQHRGAARKCAEAAVEVLARKAE
jgi:3-deoxy-D-manno-octulosonic-acid transferase